MENRRRFLTRGLGALSALAGTGLLLRGQDPADHPSRGMITPATQEAIDAGLLHLQRTQNNDGSFGTGQQHGNVAITAICGLAFMAGGHQPGRGRYGRVVTRALEYILSQEDQNVVGFLSNRAGGHGPMYGHGFATLFLAEAHGMVDQPALRSRLRGTLDRAVKLIVNTQNKEGGWRYHPQQNDADISVTICQIMALRAARNAGFAVPKTTADRCVDYVKLCQDLHSGGFRYQRQPQGRSDTGFARTAAGVVALYSAGLYDGREVEKGLEFLKRSQPGKTQGGFFADPHYFYGQYYAAQAMWIAGGRYWTTWYPAIRNELLSPQLRQGGVWQGGNPPDQHYCTGMALIILQIPNNYLPILQR